MTAMAPVTNRTVPQETVSQVGAGSYDRGAGPDPASAAGGARGGAGLPDHGHVHARFGFHQLPALRRGDLVAISGCGAYASAMSTRYNGRPRPAEVFIHPGGNLEVAQARQQVS
jgi:hypothetical protein